MGSFGTVSGSQYSENTELSVKQSDWLILVIGPVN